MADQVEVPFTGTSKPSEAVDQGQERSVNFYPVIDRGKMRLYPTAGTTLKATIAGTDINHRGAYVYEGVAYLVVGTKLYTMIEDGTVTEIGTLLTGTNRVVFASSTTQLMFVDGIYGYYYTYATGALTRITDTDFPNGTTHVTYNDGYFICARPNTGQFELSGLLDAGTWPGDVANAEAAPDYAKAVIEYGNGIWIIGTETTEQYRDTGAADFPYSRVEGSVFRFGTSAPHSVAQSADSFLFLARSKHHGAMPMQFSAGELKPIFNEEYVRKIAEMSVIDDAFGMVYQQDGHEFYVLTFPSENVTYVYDLSTGMVHERQSFVNNGYSRWIANTHFYIGNTHFIGDYTNGKIYKLDTDAYDENGEYIRRIRRSPIYKNSNNRTTVYKLQLHCETNQALVEGQGNDPQVIMKYSTDGGHLFSNEIWRDLGTSGEFQDVVIWHALGQGRKWVVEICVSDPIKWIILEMSAVFSEEE